MGTQDWKEKLAFTVSREEVNISTPHTITQTSPPSLVGMGQGSALAESRKETKARSEFVSSRGSSTNMSGFTRF